MTSGAALAWALCGGIAGAAGQQQTPSPLRAGVEFLAIQVQVVAAAGKPMPALTSEQFDVQVQGRTRRVIFAEFLHYDDGAVQPFRSQADAAALLRDGAKHEQGANKEVEFKRTSNGIHAHYLLGLEARESDRSGVTGVKVKVRQKDLTARQWAWRIRGYDP